MLFGIATIHQFQHAAAARLHRQMEMVYHFAAFRDGFHQFFCQILWMGCHIANPAQAFNLIQFLQQAGKIGAVLQIQTVTIYILTQQCNFHHTVGHQLFHFLHDIGLFTAPFPPSHIRHDTVGAEIIAAVHNIH